jgi:hypothetical protein
LAQRAHAKVQAAQAAQADGDWKKQVDDALGSSRSRPPSQPRPSNRQTVLEAATKSVVRSVGSSVGREIGKQLLRGILGSMRR